MGLKMCLFKFAGAAGAGAGSGTTLWRPRTAVTLREGLGPAGLALASRRCSIWSSGLSSGWSLVGNGGVPEEVVCGLSPEPTLLCLSQSSHSTLLSN